MVTALETVASATSPLRLEQPVLLTGFGCTTRSGSGGVLGGSLVFTVGWVAVSRLPVAVKNNYYLLTKAELPIVPPLPQGEKATGSDLCPGDSGGATYVTGLNPSNRDWRRVVGVNSGVGRFDDGRIKGPSFIVSLSSSPAADLLKNWAAKTLDKMKSWPAASDTTICGLPGAQSPLCR